MVWGGRLSSLIPKSINQSESVSLEIDNTEDKFQGIEMSKSKKDISDIKSKEDFDKHPLYPTTS
ncbi:MAG: hypothetical protein PWQ63_1357 [Methanolobus sp.]|nr:hypothetical protein [Methanolobus sp.]